MRLLPFRLSLTRLFSLFAKAVCVSPLRAAFPVGFPATEWGFPSEEPCMCICICRTASRSSFNLKIPVCLKSSCLDCLKSRGHTEVWFPFRSFKWFFAHRLVVNFCPVTARTFLPTVALASLSGGTIITLISWLNDQFHKFPIRKQETIKLNIVGDWSH